MNGMVDAGHRGAVASSAERIGTSAANRRSAVVQRSRRPGARCESRLRWSIEPFRLAPRLGMARRLAVASVAIAACVVASLVAPGSTGTAGALPGSGRPRLSLNRLIRTSPFVGSGTTAGDNEDIAYVPSDDALWIADDNADALYEVDRQSGALRDKILQSSFVDAHQLGFGGVATQSRTEDLEALAYDASADVLYAFSGSTNAVATVYRLTRNASHRFRVESWQPLPSEWTGAAWRRADGLLYVVNGSTFRTFDYSTASFGPNFSVPGLSKVTGIGFDESSGDLIAVNRRLYRVAMATRAIRPRWKAVRLKGLGIGDSRGAVVIDNQIFISDGSEAHPPRDPTNHAIFVIDVTGTQGHARHAPKSKTSPAVQQPSTSPAQATPADPTNSKKRADSDDTRKLPPQSNGRGLGLTQGGRQAGKGPDPKDPAHHVQPSHQPNPNADGRHRHRPPGHCCIGA